MGQKKKHREEKKKKGVRWRNWKVKSLNHYSVIFCAFPRIKKKNLWGLSGCKMNECVTRPRDSVSDRLHQGFGRIPSPSSFPFSSPSWTESSWSSVSHRPSPSQARYSDSSRKTRVRLSDKTAIDALLCGWISGTWAKWSRKRRKSSASLWHSITPKCPNLTEGPKGVLKPTKTWAPLTRSNRHAAVLPTGC